MSGTTDLVRSSGIVEQVFQPARTLPAQGMQQRKTPRTWPGLGPGPQRIEPRISADARGSSAKNRESMGIYGESLGITRCLIQGAQRCQAESLTYFARVTILSQISANIG